MIASDLLDTFSELLFTHDHFEPSGLRQSDSSTSPPHVMRRVLPGKPQAKLQAFDSVSWNDSRITVRFPANCSFENTRREASLIFWQTYVSGASLIVLKGPHQLLQTLIPRQDGPDLTAVAVDPVSGKIATLDGAVAYIFHPLPGDKANPKVSSQSSTQSSIQPF